ncbi:MAG TPA: GvpL/GvpF family gas vesicle protein [Actinomycetes bacterium]|nr:GvpL/GvpF family gas vesicle protein [Actinomycetes bacterium]
MTLLVHAIIRAEDGQLAGLAQHGARVVADDVVAAVVSDVAGEIDERDAAPHLELLSALAETIPALPVSFATVAPDDEAVRRELLRPAGEVLRRQVESVADLIEVRLRVHFDEQTSLRAVVAEDEQLRRLSQASRAEAPGGSALLTLGEQVVTRLTDRHASMFWALVAPVVEIADRVQVLAQDHERQAAAFLLVRGHLPDMDAAVARMREALPANARLDYVGPLPPLAFLADVLAETAADQQRSSGWGW